MAIADFIDVRVSLELAPVIAEGFGIPMILGLHTRFADRFLEYTDPADMLSDGFISTDAEYRAALALMSQEETVERFLIGRRLTPVAQVVQINIVGTSDGAYSVSLNGLTTTPFAASGSTATQIRDALIAAIDVLAGSSVLVNVDAATVDADTLSITALNPGESFLFEVTSPSDDLTAVQTVINVGVAEDLAAILEENALWYCTILTDRDRWDILEGAVWTEPQVTPHILIAQSSEASSRDTVYDSVSSVDLASILAQREYNRVALLWHDDDSERADAAWAGAMLPTDPGSETWAMKPLVGITAADLTTTQRNNLVGAEYGLGKNANIYYAVTNQITHTWRGQVASGQWIDLVRYGDSVQARIAQGLVTLQASRPKIPMTDDGIAAIEKEVAAVLQQDEDDGKLAKVPKFTTTAPLASEISDADRQARRLVPAIGATAQGSGAIHEIGVRVQVTQ